jgi:hypothetical protein
VSEPQCAAIGGIVSGVTPSTAKAPYTTPDLYPLGGAANYTALAAEGLITCEPDTVFNNSLVSPTGDPSQRLLASFSESCPDLFGVAPQFGVSTPEDNLMYVCSATCIDWLINYGVCSATDLQEV